MKKQLLITTFATIFSSMTLAQEAPTFNHAEKLQWFIKYGETASNCPHMAGELPVLKALMNNVEQRNSETGVVGFTTEEKSYLENLDAIYNQHHKVTIDELTSGNTQSEDAQDGAEKADQ